MATHKRFSGTHVFAPKPTVSEAYLKMAKESEQRIAKKYATAKESSR